MLALVTGGHGFVGSHLCERLLASGHRVRVLSRPDSRIENLNGLNVEIVRGDLRDPKTLPSAVRGCQWVFHLAGALKGFRESDFFRTNADGTRNLVEACAEHSEELERLVYISSLAAAGPSKGGSVPLTEDSPPNPVTWYGRSKLAGEEIVRSAPGLSWTIIRPPIVFGPRDRDVYRYFRIASHGWLPVLGFRDRYYSMIYAPDLADGIVSAAESSVARSQTYYLSGMEVVSWVELGRWIADALGVKGRLIRIPDVAGVAAGALADLFARARRHPQIFSLQKVIEMRQPAWVCSPEKAARDFGWRAQTPISEAIRRTVQWYRDHAWL